MFNERGIKNAFEKVKKDIFNLGDEFSSVKHELLSIKSQIDYLTSAIEALRSELILKDHKIDRTNKPYEIDENLSSDIPTNTPTHNSKMPAFSDIPTDTPTDGVEIGGLIYPKLGTSMRNGGVPTDRQTDQQTDNFPHFYAQSSPSKPLNQHLYEASEILASLDGIKKEIRLKFKQMTQQEMLVFSTIYQLEEQSSEGVEYRQIAQKLGLSESSIRDYTQKLIQKGIPIEKLKLNNKKILLRISPKLKEIAPLEALLRLREL